MIYARQSTAIIVTVGPTLDADGVAVTGGVVGDYKISKNGGAPAALNASATYTHRHTGYGSLSLTASDVDTVGTVEITMDDTTNACPMKEIQVLEPAVYDALFADTAPGFATVAALDAVDNFIDTEIADIQARLPAALVSGRMDSNMQAAANDVITAAVIAAGAIDAATFAADVDAEILSYIVDDATRIDASSLNTATVTTVPAIVADTNELQTDWTNGGRLDLILDARASQTSVDTIDNFIDTEIASIISTLGGPSDFGGGGGATIAGNLSDIHDDSDSTVNSLAGLVMVAGATIGATGNSTTQLHLDGLAYADDAINSMTVVIRDVSTGLYYSRWIEDFATTGDLATVATLPFTPEASVDQYWLLPMRADVTGGSGLDAAGVRAAVGLASANLDTQLSTIDDFLDTEMAATLAAVDTEIASIISTLGTPAGASLAADLVVIDNFVDDLEGRLTATRAGYLDNLSAGAVATASALTTVAGYLDTEIAAILADTNELQTDWADGGRLDLILDARASQTSVNTIDDFLDTEVAAILAAVDTEIASIVTAVGTTIPATLASLFTTTIAEPTYRTDGASGSLAQLMYEIMQNVGDFAISGTTKTTRKVDGSTTAFTSTLNDASTPTAITRS